MTAMMFDPRRDPGANLGPPTAKPRASAQPAPSRNSSTRQRLGSRRQRTDEDALTRTWSRILSAHTGPHRAWLIDISHEDAFAGAPEPRGPLGNVLRWMAITVIRRALQSGRSRLAGKGYRLFAVVTAVVALLWSQTAAQEAPAVATSAAQPRLAVPVSPIVRSGSAPDFTMLVGDQSAGN